MARGRVISAVLTLKDKDFATNAQKATSATKDLDRKVKHTGNSIKKFGKSATGNFKNIALGAAGLAAGFVAVRGVSDLFGSSLQAFGDFEQGMANVKAVSGVAGEEFQALSDKAREMGRATSKTASEAADGLQYLALAGWDTEQMLTGIEPVLRLSEAGALDLGRASDLATDSMAAMGIGVDGLDNYLDKVAQTARRSNTDIDEFMEGMVVAGGTFSRFNTPLEESNALMGILANRGTKGSEAGTAMNAIMTRLASTTGPAAKALGDIGVSAYDAEGNFRGLEVVLKETADKLGGMTDKQREHYQNMISGLDHGKSFDKLIKGLGDEYDSLKTEIQGADGALMDMANTQLDTFQGSMTLMGSAIDDVKITIGKGLAPVIRSLADNITDNMPAIQATVESAIGTATEKMKDMKKEWQDGTGVMGLVKTAVEGVTGAVGWIKDNSDLVISATAGIITALTGFKIVSGISSAISTFNILIAAMRAGTVAQTLAQLGLNTAMLANPLTWVAVGIGIVVAAGVALYKNWDTVREKAGELWDKTKEVFGGIYDWGVEKIQPVISFFQGLSDRFNDFKSTITSFQPPEWVMKIGGAIATGASKVRNFISGSHASGLDRVPYDGYIAELHKNEMVVPATQATNLRKQGVTINNVDRQAPVRQVTNVTNTSNTNNSGLADQLAQLIQVINNMPKGDVYVTIDGYNKSVTEIVNELVPLLKMRRANL
ncbi:phage tail tape measure protein [Ammoniphilus oxalaticus]|uniref:Phage tail tape measure protein n=1 Tax=Ammoniphilus oxalaticus TaxID=66863 RepID=A0A419SQD0_9BACL|nr:phage tail tape measure protein [Ammoniphilus oxalaticus]RKD26682.1 phage tail tape measure protein [Ammoniphilus oxalaticus]